MAPSISCNVPHRAAQIPVEGIAATEPAGAIAPPALCGGLDSLPPDRQLPIRQGMTSAERAHAKTQSRRLN